MQKANSVRRVVAEMTLVRMCDEALDTSAEALLSRMAQLEERVATGYISQKPKKKETEPLQREEPAPKAAEPKSVPVSAFASPSPEGGGAVMRPMRNWMEVVERISRSAPMDAGFVKTSKAYTTEDGGVIVCFDNAFSMGMMEKDESRDRLRAALSTVLRREVGDRQLIFEMAGKSDLPSVIDEILDATE
jgi:hypothetical protein